MSLLYHGKVTACHSLGLLDAFCTTAPSMEDFLLFEALTGVPYGVSSRTSDANRLLIPWLDPDRGLDAALEVLGIQFEVSAWPADADGFAALDLLYHWLSHGPVLLGPLDMGYLPYFFHAHLYRGCDHYVVAMNRQADGRLEIRDSEGFDRVWITAEELVQPWRGECVPEGRGSFIMRRILPVGSRLPVSHFLPTESALRRALKRAGMLLQASAAAPHSGATAYKLLADNENDIMDWPAARRSLTYLLPTRIQRNLSALTVLEAAEAVWPDAVDVMESAHVTTMQQSFLLAKCYSYLTHGTAGCLGVLHDVAALEDQLTVIYQNLGESECLADSNI